MKNEYRKIIDEYTTKKVDWYCISKYQKLSGDFIREFKDKVDWECISEYQKLSNKSKKEFIKELRKGLSGRN